jgi:hypothetical protein
MGLKFAEISAEGLVTSLVLLTPFVFKETIDQQILLAY